MVHYYGRLSMPSELTETPTRMARLRITAYALQELYIRGWEHVHQSLSQIEVPVSFSLILRS